MSAKPSDSSTPLAEISHGPSKFEQFLENNQKLLLFVAILIALGTVAFVVFQGIEKGKQEEAGASLIHALNADDLQKTIDEHSGTQAAKSARLLLADNQWSTGEKEASIATLRSFLADEPDHAAAATAKASLACKLMVQDQKDEAARLFKEVVDAPEARYLAAFALISLGDIAVVSGDIENAKRSYERVTAEFSDSEFSSSASSRLRDLGVVAPTVVAAPEPLEIKPEFDAPQPETDSGEKAEADPKPATEPEGQAAEKKGEAKDVSKDEAAQGAEKDAKSE